MKDKTLLKHDKLSPMLCAVKQMLTYARKYHQDDVWREYNRWDLNLYDNDAGEWVAVAYPKVDEETETLYGLVLFTESDNGDDKDFPSIEKLIKNYKLAIKAILLPGFSMNIFIGDYWWVNEYEEGFLITAGGCENVSENASTLFIPKSMIDANGKIGLPEMEK